MLVADSSYMELLHDDDEGVKCERRRLCEEGQGEAWILLKEKWECERVTEGLAVWMLIQGAISNPLVSPACDWDGQ